MIVYGVDPGITGAIAYYDKKLGVLQIKNMPTLTEQYLKKGKLRKRKYTDENEVVTIIKNFNRQSNQSKVMFIEKVAARPGQGVTGMFGFGRSLGVLIGVAAALELPTVLVTPQKWRKFTKCAKGKDGSLAKARELFPADAEYFKLKKHDGRSDAALIAYYGSFYG